MLLRKSIIVLLLALFWSGGGFSAFAEENQTFVYRPKDDAIRAALIALGDLGLPCKEYDPVKGRIKTSWSDRSFLPGKRKLPNRSPIKTGDVYQLRLTLLFVFIESQTTEVTIRTEVRFHLPDGSWKKVHSPEPWAHDLIDGINNIGDHRIHAEDLVCGENVVRKPPPVGLPDAPVAAPNRVPGQIAIEGEVERSVPLPDAPVAPPNNGSEAFETIPKSEATSESEPIETESDFRRMRWGTDKQAVRNGENAKFVEEKEDALLFRNSLAGLHMDVLYLFYKNRLCKGVYFVADRHTNQLDYIGDFDRLEKLLTKKYGLPMEKYVVWRNDLYKNEPLRWGEAVAAGDLSYLSRWETATTDIALELAGDNYKVQLTVRYESKALMEEKRKEAEQKALDLL